MMGFLLCFFIVAAYSSWNQQSFKVSAAGITSLRSYQHGQSVQQEPDRSAHTGNVQPIHIAPGNYGNPSVVRTATSGLVYKIMVTLTIFAFVSNGAFLVYVFWLSK